MNDEDTMGIRPLGMIFDSDESKIYVNDAGAPDDDSAETLVVRSVMSGTTVNDECAPRDGRYLGGSHQLDIELRMDIQGSGVVSGDLFRRDPSGGSTYVASFRTAPRIDVTLNGRRIPVTAQDRHDATAIGYLDLAMPSESCDHLQGAILFESALEGLPVKRPIPFTTEHQGSALRRIGLEMDIEEGVDPIPEIVHDGTPMSLEKVFLNAGIELYPAGIASKIPTAPSSGWSEKALFDLMLDFAEGISDEQAFAMQVLWLSVSKRSGLLGVMFDSQDAFERQALAVFAGEIRSRFGGGRQSMKLIQTTAHEIGHACNLVHRFERTVRRANSTSIMNYDWRYRGGGLREEYWRNFYFAFDDDELNFLRHARRPDIIPGGHGFHSARYWADGTGGYSPYVPEKPLGGFRLALLPPGNGTLFAFGQPVILGLELTNTSGRSITLPSFVLDQKAGFIEIMIRRVSHGRHNEDMITRFQPIVGRCFDFNDSGVVQLAPGEKMHANLNLTFGASGFGFAEPGSYDVQALFVIFDRANERDFITPSDPLRIRVAYPKETQDELDADTLFQPETGFYFALAGTNRLRDVEDKLTEIADRRTRGARRTRKSTSSVSTALLPRDPIAVNIIRCKAFNANREYIRYRDGHFERHQENPGEAWDNASRLDSRALKVFDVVTAEETKRYSAALKAKYLKQ